MNQQKCINPKSRSTLCIIESCKYCFNRSFASHDKAKFWSSKNISKPRDSSKSSGKLFYFDCEKCKHTFETRLNMITCGNHWCP